VKLRSCIRKDYHFIISWIHIKGLYRSGSLACASVTLKLITAAWVTHEPHVDRVQPVSPPAVFGATRPLTKLFGHREPKDRVILLN